MVAAVLTVCATALEVLVALLMSLAISGGETVAAATCELDTEHADSAGKGSGPQCRNAVLEGHGASRGAARHGGGEGDVLARGGRFALPGSQGGGEIGI